MDVKVVTFAFEHSMEVSLSFRADALFEAVETLAVADKLAAADELKKSTHASSHVGRTEAEIVAEEGEEELGVTRMEVVEEEEEAVGVGIKVHDVLEIQETVI